jgi:homoserine O-acetyltransferase
VSAASSARVHDGSFALGTFHAERGGLIPDAVLRYRVFGDLAAIPSDGANLVFHALTGNTEVDAWWGALLAPGMPLDPQRRPLIAANLLGGCGGSSGPTSADWGQFPELTTADLARAHEPLLAALGVERLHLVTGGSLGGMVALQWGLISPLPIERLVVIAAPARTTAQNIAWNTAQRLALEADPRWGGGRYHADAPPQAGLAAARAIAMITYRSAAEFEARFSRATTRVPGRFDIEVYLRRHGEKLVARFDARSYMSLMTSMDLHDIGDLASAAPALAQRVAQVVGIGIDSDILYPANDVREWTAALARQGVATHYAEIHSLYGHDAFLIEFDQVAAMLSATDRQLLNSSAVREDLQEL